jgi:hypothetical protein
MNDTFTREQLERLLEIAYLGERMINGPAGDDEHSEPHCALLRQLCALAHENGLGYLVEEDGDGGFRPSEAFLARMDLAGFVGDYDDWVFWDELALRFAERELRKELGDVAWGALPEKERRRRVNDLAKRYDKEFDKHGIDRLRLSSEERRRAGRGTFAEKLRKLFEEGEEK